MNQKSQRLSIVLELAEKEVDKAVEKLAKAQNQLSVERQKLDEIVEYLNDYSASCEKSGSIFSPEQMIRQRAFVRQLSEAQTQQRHAIAKAEREVEDKKSLWQQNHLKQRAMQELVKRLVDEETKIATKHEEKLLDEWALQQFQRNIQHSKLH